jgi:hypothetical protein
LTLCGRWLDVLCGALAWAIRAPAYASSMASASQNGAYLHLHSPATFKNIAWLTACNRLDIHSTWTARPP